MDHLAVSEWNNGKCQFQVKHMAQGCRLSKKLTVTDDYWRRLFVNEIFVHRCATIEPTCFTIPRLEYADIRNLEEQFEYIPSTPLSKERYPSQGYGKLSALLTGSICREIQEVKPVNGMLSFNIFQWIQKSSSRRCISDKTSHILLRPTLSQVLPYTLAHGDLLPTNIGIGEGGSLVIYDWEFAGLFIKHYDAALINSIHHLCGAAGFDDGFDLDMSEPERFGYWVNVLVVATREARLSAEIGKSAITKRARELRIRAEGEIGTLANGL